MKKLTIIPALLVLIWNLQAQSKANEAMEKLSFLTGNWKGTAHAYTGPGQSVTLDHEENVAYRLSGKMLTFEGKSFEEGNLKFNAFGIITFNEKSKEYEMQAWLSSGENTKAYWIERSEFVWEWGFDIPEGGKIKYVISVSEKGQWDEKGEYSPDGNTWYPSFSMLLDKVE